MKEIEEIVSALSAEHDVKVKKSSEVLAFGYSVLEDLIYYNPPGIKHLYESHRNYSKKLDLESFVKHSFGHELGHRNKYAEFNRAEAIKKEAVYHNLLKNPQKVARVMGENVKFLYFLRLGAVVYSLFEEHYADENNPLYSTRVWMVECIRAIDILKQDMQNVRKVLHALPVFKYEVINSYFVAPLTLLPAKALRIFPEYRTLQKIKLYLKKIRTARDVFDEDKIEEVSEILLYEL